MRVRRMKNLESRRARVAGYLIEPPQSGGLDFGQVFGNKNAVHMELGCGKGGFICALSQQCPDINFIGVERVPEVLVMAMEKAQQAGRENVRYLCCDVRALAEMVAPGSVGRIYLNFSDPWPKDRHAKRRLTAAPFLELYEQILAPGGQLHLKTDNRNLFEYSLRELENRGASISDVCYDLHASGCPGNVMTEYERKFVEMGLPIHRLVATFA